MSVNRPDYKKVVLRFLILWFPFTKSKFPREMAKDSLE